MEIAVTAEKLYEERKDFWLICDLRTVSGISLYNSAYGLIGNALFLPLYYLLCQYGRVVIAVKNMICLLNR